jgi:catechol 2,3-dioxygenase-like lactoylglutathione lyase family enzyme
MAITDAPIHPSLAVRDLRRARTWYAEKLGWEPTRELEGLLVYEVGDSYFTLFETPHAGTAENTVMNWELDDLLSEMGRLRDRGVTFEDYDFGEAKTVDGVMVDPFGGKTAWFRDVDGNTIALIQAPPGRNRSHNLTVMLAATDLDRAKAWYRDKLGFDPVEEFAGVVAAYSCADTTFSVYSSEFAGTAKNTVAVWRMQNIRREVARLRERGVAFDDYDMGEDGKTVDGILSDAEGDLNAWFRDSEGNILSLAEDRGEFPE